MTHLLDVCFERLSVRPVTMNLVEHLLLDMPLTPAETVDFGVDTQHHYRVLQIIVQDACYGWSDIEDEEGYGLLLLELHRVISELDAALGNGEKLNELIKTYVPEYGGLVHFHTTWDELLGRTDQTVEAENS